MTEWVIAKNGEKHGPFTTEQLKELAATGKLLSTDMVWRDGLEGWAKASMLKGLEFSQPEIRQDKKMPDSIADPNARKRQLTNANQNTRSDSPAKKYWQLDLLILSGILVGFTLLLGFSYLLFCLDSKSLAFSIGKLLGQSMIGLLVGVFFIRPYDLPLFYVPG
ncbi:MAG: DUF4339 domain-containing protein [Phycisphaerales bacterium]|nr:DUF4339 domain-containing protein [Phycisphaerales bacterium]